MILGCFILNLGCLLLIMVHGSLINWRRQRYANQHGHVSDCPEDEG